MKFKYVGQPGEKLHLEDVEHHAFGYDFSGGQVVEVKEKAFIEKLSGNCHYEEVDGTGGKAPSHMNKEQLIAYAVENEVDVDKSKSKKEMLVEIQANIKAKEDGENDN